MNSSAAGQEGRACSKARLSSGCGAAYVPQLPLQLPEGLQYSSHLLSAR